MATTEELPPEARRFNAAVRAECEAHAEDYHRTCGVCGVEWCAYWTESEQCPECDHPDASDQANLWLCS